MGKLIIGPWGNKAQFINKASTVSNYKLCNYLESIEKQEHAYKSSIYLVIYMINSDVNRTFLIPGIKLDVDKQRHSRTPEFIKTIKEKLK